MFETFEDEGTHWVRGEVFVIAVLDRDTLKLKGYVDQAFLTEEEANDHEFRVDVTPDIAYVVQRKDLMVQIHRSEE
jgi:hypothetical protein